ncbi:phosphoribosylformylglycinamidine synthase [Spatholobus suberectus]|nr:phosphoribosylformylglycinamidine synthase [Spatholobus suberectus]
MKISAYFEFRRLRYSVEDIAAVSEIGVAGFLQINVLILALIWKLSVLKWLLQETFEPENLAIESFLEQKGKEGLKTFIVETLLDSSNGASDYGNKFGEPLIQGFCRTIGMRLSSEDNGRNQSCLVEALGRLTIYIYQGRT